MKKIIASIFMFSLFIYLYAENTLLFEVGEFSDKMFPDSQKCEIKTDELGRIIRLKYEKENSYSSITYDESAHIIVHFADGSLRELNIENLNFHVDNDSFCINRFFDTTEYKYEFKNQLLICFDVTKNEIKEYYICRESDDNYELCLCRYVCSLRDSGYDSDALIFDSQGYNYIYSKKEINNLKSKDKSINLLNAKILIAEGIFSLVPFILINDSVVTTPDYYKASSELKEKTAFYEAENLRTLDGLPWASNNGYGINDKIFIKTPSLYNMKLAIYNGYQSKTRKDLYKANSRAKKIKIRNLETGNFIEINLIDTPAVQNISLEKLDVSYNVYTTLEITILEVYPGDKYKDLCIQAIIPVY